MNRADTVNIAASDGSGSVIRDSQENSADRQSFVRKTKTLSHCNCQLDSFDGQFLLCRYAKEWLACIEHRTD